MNKVVVSKEVFDALQYMESVSITGLKNLVMKKIEGYVFSIEGNYYALNGISLEETLDIYKKGYELEMTADEKILLRWKKAKEMSNDSRFFYLEGILDTLNDFKIKVKGINS